MVLLSGSVATVVGSGIGPSRTGWAWHERGDNRSGSGTVPAVDRDTQARLLPTPFVASWIGRAREADRFACDRADRAAGWARWAVGHLATMTGLGDRPYPALVLDGRFYDPKRTGPSVAPHLEIPARVLARPGRDFPDRLGAMGNGLAFAWWTPHEVIGARRALFNVPSTPVEDLLARLERHRPGLEEALVTLNRTAGPQWATVEGLLVSDPALLSDDVAGDFGPTEVSAFFPAGTDLDLHVAYDQRLREKSGVWACRRLGVWQVQGSVRGSRFALGVITPRLTLNSTFRDHLFTPARESAAALLVRGLLLSRIIARHLDGRTTTVAAPPPGAPSGYLRAVVAQVGAKIPEAGVNAAVLFLQDHADPDRAWAALSEWAERTGSLLTVSVDGFKAAHRNALRYLRRAETPEREDLNVVLPLAWDARQRVVRVTYSRGSAARREPVPERGTAGTAQSAEHR